MYDSPREKMTLDEQGKQTLGRLTHDVMNNREGLGKADKRMDLLDARMLHYERIDRSYNYAVLALLVFVVIAVTMVFFELRRAVEALERRPDIASVLGWGEVADSSDAAAPKSDL